MRHLGNCLIASGRACLFGFGKGGVTAVAIISTLSLSASWEAVAQTSVPRFAGMIDPVRNPQGGVECPARYIQFDIIWRKGKLFSEPLTCVPATVCTPGPTYEPTPCSSLMRSGGPKYPRKPIYIDQTRTATAAPAPRPASRPRPGPPQPAPPFQLTPTPSYGNGCIKLSAGPTRWVQSGEKGWALEGTVVLRNVCAQAQLAEARIGSPVFPDNLHRPIPPWQPQNFMQMGRRLWTPPIPRNLGFSPIYDSTQVFVVAGNGIMHATVRFGPRHADQLYPLPPYRIGGESVSCARFENGRERTVFTDGSHRNFRCHPLPWPGEDSDRPDSYHRETRDAYRAQLGRACTKPRAEFLAWAGAEGPEEIRVMEVNLMWSNAAKTMQRRFEATRGRQNPETRLRICLADARIWQIQRKWLPSWDVR